MRWKPLLLISLVALTVVVQTSHYYRESLAGSVSSGAGGDGDVSGPVSSVDNTVPRFNGTTGKSLQTSGVVITDTDFMGIGTIPAHTLDISGALTATQRVLGTSGVVYLTTQNNGQTSYFGNDNATGDAFVAGSSPYATIIAGVNTAPVHFIQGNTIRMSLDTSGNLVVGTVTATGELQTAGNRVNYNLTTYAAGTAYSLTTTPAALDFGTTDPVIVLDKAGTYKISGRVQLRYNGATFSASRTATLKFRRTNNTPIDIPNSSTALLTAVTTTFTETFVAGGLPDIIYTTAGTTDSLTIFGDVATLPSAGSLDAVEASIIAVRLY